MLHMEVPHLHELFFALVDVGEFVEHAADFGHQPRRVHLVLRGLFYDGVRRHGEVRRRVVIQPAREKEQKRSIAHTSGGRRRQDRPAAVSRTCVRTSIKHNYTAGIGCRQQAGGRGRTIIFWPLVRSMHVVIWEKSGRLIFTAADAAAAVDSRTIFLAKSTAAAADDDRTRLQSQSSVTCSIARARAQAYTLSFLLHETT